MLVQANGANEDGTTFPGLGKIDYVLTEDSVKIIILELIIEFGKSSVIIINMITIMIIIIIMIIQISEHCD